MTDVRSLLFSPVTLRGLTLRNRVVMSPMCTYSASGGVAGPWHLVHLGSRALGGAGAVMVEATAVSPQGRISAMDMGLWSDEQAAALAPIARFIADAGAAPAIQLAHAGRKASTTVPWLGHRPIYEPPEGWTPVAPSAIPYASGYAAPREMTADEIDRVVDDFVDAARRAHAAGFRMLECHMAHGYLLHSFLSPITNQRRDDHGGELRHRARLPLRVAAAVREAWPDELPLSVRISATDWIDGGWDLEQSIQLARWMKDLGVDLIDCSSGAISAAAKAPVAPGFQVPFAAEIRRQVGIATAAVGLITDAAHAESIVRECQADLVFIGRAFLDDPHWALHAAEALSAASPWPAPYARAVRGLRAAGCRAGLTASGPASAA